MEICSICHPAPSPYERWLEREEAKSTAELKARKGKESMPNTCKTMDFSALVETVNRGMGEMQKTPMFVEYLGSMWRLRELKLAIHMYGWHSLSVILEPVDVSRSSLTVDLETTGSSFSAQTIS
jgi:hypothetical protein